MHHWMHRNFYFLAIWYDNPFMVINVVVFAYYHCLII